MCASRCRAARACQSLFLLFRPRACLRELPMGADLGQGTGSPAAARPAAPGDDATPGAQVRPARQARRACCSRLTRRPRRLRWRAAWRPPRRARRPPPARAASARCSAAGPSRGARTKPAAWRRLRAGRACSGARSSATRARRAPRPGRTAFCPLLGCVCGRSAGMLAWDRPGPSACRRRAAWLRPLAGRIRARGCLSSRRYAAHHAHCPLHAQGNVGPTQNPMHIMPKCDAALLSRRRMRWQRLLRRRTRWTRWWHSKTLTAPRRARATPYAPTTPGCHRRA